MTGNPGYVAWIAFASSTLSFQAWQNLQERDRSSVRLRSAGALPFRLRRNRRKSERVKQSEGRPEDRRVIIHHQDRRRRLGPGVLFSDRRLVVIVLDSFGARQEDL